MPAELLAFSESAFSYTATADTRPQASRPMKGDVPVAVEAFVTAISRLLPRPRISIAADRGSAVGSGAEVSQRNARAPDPSSLTMLIVQGNPRACWCVISSPLPENHRRLLASTTPPARRTTAPGSHLKASDHHNHALLQSPRGALHSKKGSGRALRADGLGSSEARRDLSRSVIEKAAVFFSSRLQAR